MSLFFKPGFAPDEIYRIIRDDSNDRSVEARELVESLWREVRDYLDPDVPKQAAVDFGARFWEVYLAWTLLSNGTQLVPHRERPDRGQRGGPDLLTQDGVWIEATLATPGKGPNRTPDRVRRHRRSRSEDHSSLTIVDRREMPKARRVHCKGHLAR